MFNNTLFNHSPLAGMQKDITHAALLNEKQIDAIRQHIAKMKHSIIEFASHSNVHYTGDLVSSFSGRGYEFDSHRPYQNGDDIRHIDWRVFARKQAMYTRLYYEERKPGVFVVLDRQSSMRFGTKKQLKVTLAAKLALAHIFQGMNTHVPVGGAVIDENNQWFNLGNHAPTIEALIHAITRACPPANSDSTQNTTALLMHQALQRVQQTCPAGVSVIILSDFMDSDVTQQLYSIAENHPVSTIHIIDSAEAELPLLESYLIESGSQEPIHLSSSDKDFYHAYANSFKNTLDSFDAKLAGMQIRGHRFRTDDDFDTCLKNLAQTNNQ